MKKIVISVFVALTIAGLLPSFAHAIGISPRQPPDPIININQLTLRFATGMMNSQDDKNDNFVASPANIAIALKIIDLGAAGTTKTELDKLLFSDLAPSGANYNEELGSLKSFRLPPSKNAENNVELLSANSIWVNRKVAVLKPDVAEYAQRSFSTKINDEDFSDPAVPAKINSWVSENTKGLVTKVIDTLNADDAMVLSSTLYFKGAWAYKFDKALTKDGAFTPDGGMPRQLPMMHQHFGAHGGLSYLDGTDFEAVALGYGTKEQSPMRLILIRPKNADTSARDWLSVQQEAAADSWVDAGRYETFAGDVSLPHIDIRQHIDLIPPLKALGLKTAFGKDADFSAMAEVNGKGLYISRMTHDVVFKTDEQGSEAAAVTTITMAPTMAMVNPKTVNIAFDRSFVFALQDTSTGAVLFIGAVNRPDAAE